MKEVIKNCAVITFNLFKIAFWIFVFIFAAIAITKYFIGG